MAQRVDCHAHSWFSFDARASIDEMCRGAWERGVKVLTLTEHYDFGEPPVQEHYARRAARRMAEMRQARAEWAGKVELLCGIELGQPAWEPEGAAALLRDNDFDLVIGSVHALPPGDDIYNDCAFDSLAACDAVYDRWFQEARRLVRWGDFDTFGHFDYPLRLMEHWVPEGSLRRWREPMLALLRELAKSGRALELNTSGARRWIGRPGGEAWLLEAWRDFGGRWVTVGGDAHRGADVGAGVDLAYDQLRRAGIREIAVFRDRRPFPIPLD